MMFWCWLPVCVFVGWLLMFITRIHLDDLENERRRRRREEYEDEVRFGKYDHKIIVNGMF